MILLIKQNHKLSPKFLSLYHRLVTLSTLIKESSLCSKWKLIQGLRTGQCTKAERLWSGQPQMGHMYYCPLKAQESL